ncbi:MAG: hypothetical protein Q7V05_13280 [Methanoregula sp.]|nr:hypothetical protein [Methanoregula sp.]
MKKLPTWAGRSEFEYEGSIATGTTIYYGSGSSTVVSASQYSALLQHFKGQSPNIGTSRDRAPEGSVGAWLQKNITRTAIASYVGAILIHEGYATKGYESPTIKFK